MIFLFSSLSIFVNKVLRQLELNNLSPGDKIEINLSRSSNLLDLFVLGRLLAFLHQVRSTYSVNAKFIFPGGKRQKHLEQLGFFEYCSAENIECEFAQLDLFDTPDMRKPDNEPRPWGRSYWDCIIPLRTCPFVSSHDEAEIAAQVDFLIQQFSDEVTAAHKERGFDLRYMSSELSQLFNGMVRELISNTITHSRCSNFTFAMCLSRETGVEYRPHRAGTIIPSGQDKLEFLIMDMGQGVYPSVLTSLNRRGSEVDYEYFSIMPWKDSKYLYWHNEQSLLSTIFRGDLVIRKGRKSEGLYEIGQALAWFGGMLHYFTGRTEIRLSSSDSQGLSISPRVLRKPYYLPGVIASAVLPSYQLRSSSIRAFISKGVTAVEQPVRQCEIKRLPRLPNGLFGGSSAGRVRRRGELDSEWIILNYQQTSVDEALSDKFFDINLKVSDNVDVNFIDSLLQELCKRIDEVESHETKNFFKIIFTNVPRNIINDLRKRNCTSFLMLKNTFCLFLDEADEPHFLGLPRISRNAFDLEDALKFIFYAGSVTPRDLISALGLTESAVSHLQKLLTHKTNAVFTSSDRNGEIKFHSYDIREALNNLRRKRFEDLSAVRLTEGNSTVFKLRNGTFVDSIYDFCLLWSDNDCLIDSAKLILSEAGFPLVDCIVAFMNNGDRLASAIQRFTKTPSLIIVDPHTPNSWHILEIQGEILLVVDALYEGDDENGYVREFVDFLKDTKNKARLKLILAFCDFRRNIDPEGPRYSNSVAGVDSVSVPLPDGFLVPTPVAPSEPVTVLQNLQNYVLSKPKLREDSANTADDLVNWHAYNYSPIELSTEFWQNVSALRIIDTERTGRESRNVLFYEDNERLIRNPRTRRSVVEFIADYIKNSLLLNVDVIIHPAHPVGSFLAQTVSAQLSTPPIVLPITQRTYGGQLELTPGDYTYFHDKIRTLSKNEDKRKPNCLILDDSVLSGNSLSTMLGIASRLGLQTAGILVLLSRLTPEISKTLSSLPLHFASLYRLHMPVLNEEHSPDTRLKYLNERVLANSNSYFAQLHAAKLRDEQSHFGPFNSVAPEPPCIRESSLQDIAGQHIETFKLKHIINNLILHPDPNIINFKTRIAITYNFLEQLAQENVFWRLLYLLYSYEDEPAADSQSIQFIQKVIYVLAFSKYVHSLPVYQQYEQTCSHLIIESATGEKWIELCELMADCILALGIIGSSELLRVGPRVLAAVTSSAIADSLFQNESVKADRKLSSARLVLGSLAWSLQVLVSQKGHSILENEQADDWIASVRQAESTYEGDLVLIDILESVISASKTFRNKLEITQWRDEDGFLQEISSGRDNPDMQYLSEAPGYSCTLKSILRVCKADIVVLYAKNSSDQGFFVRVFETAEPIRATRELQPEHLKQDYLPQRISKRMNESLFFLSTDLSESSKLNVFLQGATYKWSLGGAVNTKDDKIKYYVVLGFKNRLPSTQLTNTTYYYWLKCESLLRGVLPSIYSRYIESSTAWNALVQSLSPVHPLRLDAVATEPFNARRKMLRQAMGYMDTADLLRRSVRMASEPIYKLQDIRSRIGTTVWKLQSWYAAALKDHTELANSLLKREAEDWPITLNHNWARPEEDHKFCALPMALLEFIAFECLCNALSYYSESIQVAIDFVREPPANFGYMLNPTESRLIVRLTVSNDIHPSRETKKGASTGTHACETAAAAVGGNFCYHEDPNGKFASAVTDIPAYPVPDSLAFQLYDYLT